MPPDTLASISLVNTSNQPEIFARKVVVIAYTLQPDLDGVLTPHFLLSVICPKQKYRSLAEWKKAKHFRLPSGYSLIKGTREMIYAAERLDIPPGFGRYFNPSVWDKKFQIDSEHQEIVARIDGLMPAVSTALVEAKEEGGIKPKHIKQLIDMGVVSAKMDGRVSHYHCIAMELHKMAYGKAKDSLKLNYFTYQDLKVARKTRLRYNIPLVRPSHFLLLKQVRKQLKAVYRSLGTDITFKGSTRADKESLAAVKADFKKLIKRGGKGDFVCHKMTPEESIKRIIKRSKHSRRKVKKLKKLIS